MSDDFYKRLDEKERNGRIARIFADRPENLHDYQGCTNASKLPSAPSPAEETASEPEFVETNSPSQMSADALDAGATSELIRNPKWLPEPVSPEGIHVPRIPGTVNTPVGPMIPKSAPCLFEVWQNEFKANFEKEHGRPMTNLELWISGTSYNGGKNRPDLQPKVAQRSAPEAAAAGDDMPPWIQFACPTCHASSGAPCIAMASCMERVLLSKSAAPIAPAAEELIQELVEALEVAQIWLDEDCGQAPGLISAALARAEEYRKGAKNG